jgi:4-aminobutyrate--pyruvate transaminase
MTEEAAPMSDAANSIQARDVATIVHPQTNLSTLREHGPSVVVSGQGIYFTDDEGRRFIDGLSGLGCTSLGYGQRRLADAAQRQMMTLGYSPIYDARTHPMVVDLAEKLMALAPVPMSKILFQCSGSEANDTAIKLIWYANNARGRPAKKKIVGRARGYHGSTVATVSVSGQPHMHTDFDLPLPLFRHVDNPHYYRFHVDGETEEEFSVRMAANLEALILDEGPDTVAAFFAEPVQSGGGAIVPPAGYFDRIQEVLRKYDILFLVDEVISGFGRTGNMWGSQTYGLEPDMLSSAKALSAAHFPISALMVNQAIYDALIAESEKVGTFGHGYTYAGHPVGAAVALETLAIYEDLNIIDHVRRVSARFLDGLRALEDHPLVGDVSGVGLFAGIELVRDKKTREPFDPDLGLGKRVAGFAFERGLYLRSTGDRMRLMPPLIITAEEVDALLACFSGALDDAWAEVRGKRA